MEDVLTESTRAVSARLISDAFFGGSRHTKMWCWGRGSLFCSAEMDPCPNTKKEHVLLGFYSKVFAAFSFGELCGTQQGAGDFHRPLSSLLSESLLSEGLGSNLEP